MKFVRYTALTMMIPALIICQRTAILDEAFNQGINRNGLIAWFNFNSNLNDKIGSNNGSATGGSLTYVSDRFGNASYAAQLASTAYLTLGAATTTLGDSPFTLSFWYYPISIPSTTTGEILINKYNAPSGYLLKLATQGALSLFTSSNTGNETNTSGQNLSKASWQYISIVVNTNTATSTIYVGDMSGNLAVGGSIGSIHYTSTTAALVFMSGALEGIVDDVTIYNRELSFEEISENYKTAEQ